MGLLKCIKRQAKISIVSGFSGSENLGDPTLTRLDKLNTDSPVIENLYESIHSCDLKSDGYDTIDHAGNSASEDILIGYTEYHEHSLNGSTAEPDEHSGIRYTEYHEHSLNGSSLASFCTDLSTATSNVYATIDSDSDIDDVTSPPIMTEMSEELKMAIHSTVGRMLDFTDTDRSSSASSHFVTDHESFNYEIQRNISSVSSSESTGSEHIYEDIDCLNSDSPRSSLKNARQTGMVDVRRAARNEVILPVHNVQQTNNKNCSTSTSSITKRRQQIMRQLQKSSDVITLAVLGDC